MIQSEIMNQIKEIPEMPQFEANNTDHDWSVLNELVSHALPEGSQRALFKTKIPIADDGRLPVGSFELGDNPVFVPIFLGVQRLTDEISEPSEIEFTIEPANPGVVFGRPKAINFDFPAVDTLYDGEKFAGFHITIGKHNKSRIEGITVKGRTVELETDTDEQTGELAGTTKLALACAQAIKPSESKQKLVHSN